VLKLTKLKYGRCCFDVVIRRYKWLFCIVATELLTLYPERNVLAVAVKWTNSRKGCYVKDYYSAGVCYYL